ncbi:MAG: nickel-type superoxide dismutase maturation protease [Acidimicrobiales bacterium]
MVVSGAVAATVIWARPRRVVVEGVSMVPALAPGDRLLVVNLGRPREGDIVALRDPTEPGRLLVKRLTAFLPSGIEVLGDNQEASRDSRHFGPVAPSDLLGTAVYRYFPPARAGSLRHLGVSGGTLGRNGPAPTRHRSAFGT